jgi:uncharacterized protein (DUF58 family)
MPAPAGSQLQIDPRLLQRLKGIDVRSRFLVRGLYVNRHRTADFGKSTEFVEHREYRWGDELRSIDWRVYGRTNRLYVKVHEMEANMRVALVVDSSASMRVPPAPGLPGKLELAAVIAGAVATLVSAQQDAVGLLLLAERLEAEMPPRQGPDHLLELYRLLGAPRGSGGGAFGRLLLEALPRLGSRGLVLLLTDALDDLDSLGTALRQLRVRQQDTTLVHILDRNEIEFPFDRMTEFRHPESGLRLVGDPAALRGQYLERLAAFRARVADLCRQTQTGYLFLSTADDLAKLLALHLIRRLAEGGG